MTKDFLNPMNLHRTDLLPDPIDQFARWMDAALAAHLPEPTAMTLATATPDGTPSARMVLLKGFDGRGFRFFTNYESQKGQELLANPRAALVFYWQPLDRQVRITGPVSPLSPDESDAYYASRGRHSQLGAWASPQSGPLPSRAVLVARYARARWRFLGEKVSRPPYWGGFQLTPERVEFWQARAFRLHDRFVYTREESGVWTVERLSP